MSAASHRVLLSEDAKRSVVGSPVAGLLSGHPALLTQWGPRTDR